MKKLFLFLSAALLIFSALTSCGKYENQLHGLEVRVSELEDEKISSINEQITNINNSIADLGLLRTNIASAMQELTEKGEDITDLQNADKALEERIKALEEFKETVLSNYATKEYVDANSATKDWISATFLTLEQFQQTSELLATLSQKIGTIIDETLPDAIENLKTWVSTQLKGYYTIAEADAKIKVLQDQLDECGPERIQELSDSIKIAMTAIEQAKKDITSEYKAAISEAISANGGYITETIKSKFDDIDGKITALGLRIDAVEATLTAIQGRIQSITFIPEVAGNGAYADYTVDDAKPVGNPTFKDVTLKYRIAPAAKAKDLTVLNTSFYYTSVVLPGTKAVKENSISAKAVSVVDETDGIVAVTIAGEDLTSVELANGFIDGKDPKSDKNMISVSLAVRTSIEDLCSAYADLYAKRYVPVKSVAFAPATPARLAIDGSANLSSYLVFNPAEASNQDVVWSSSDPTVATVSSTTGEITPVSSGTTTIKATSVDNAGAYAEIEITVVIPVESVSLGKDSGKTIELVIPVGSHDALTYQFSATVLPADATDKTVTWVCECTTHPANKIHIDQNGLLTAEKEGSATITVYSNDDNTIKDQCTVTVSKETAVETITFKPETPTTVETGSTLDLSEYVTVNPAGATNKTLTWSSDKPALATVDATTGVVTPVALSPNGAPGDITITAKATDGSNVSGTKVIRVVAPTVHVTGISLGDDSQKTISGYIAEGPGKDIYTKTLIAKITPDNADNKNIIWTIEPVNVNPAATDYSVTNGTVAIKAAGTYKVIAKSEDKELKDSCYFDITKVSLKFADDTKKTFDPGSTYDFGAKLTVTPSSLKSSVTWELPEDLKAVASLSSTGVLTVSSPVANPLNNKDLKVNLKVSDSLTVTTSIKISINKSK